MATLQELMLRAQQLRQETAVDSISPERAGSIMYDTLAYINQMQLQDANPLLISKIYASVAAMEADSAPVSDLTGKPLRPGQVVCIVPDDDTDPDYGMIYRYDGTTGGASSWTAVGRIGDPYLEGYQYVDIATPETNPGTPDQKVFYIASTPGTYTKFLDSGSNPLEVAEGEVAVLKYDTAWTKEATGAAAADMVYRKTDDPQNIYAMVDKDGKVLFAIGADGRYKFYIPVDAPKGLSSPEIDELRGLFCKVENPEYVSAVIDKDGRIIETVRADGTKEFNIPVNFKGGVVGLPGSSQEADSQFKGKKIAWYGTSIPAGSGGILIPFNGNEIRAKHSGFSNANELTLYAKGAALPSEYPIMAASLAGAETIYNEAIGSSRAVRNTSSSDLLIRCKALGNTVQEICSYIFGSYNIDIDNQTFSENTDNTIGITTFLTTAGTWSSFVNNVFMILGFSYEICIVARYLFADSAQWAQYITDIFGEYLQDVTDMLESNGYSMERLAGYRGADVFVLEHSVNDGANLFTGDVDSTDINTFEGAYNLFIRTILRYNPSARIAIVSNYARTSGEIGANIDKATYLEAIAAHWHIPFLRMSEYSQVVHLKVRTQGYWDAGQVWHNSGFTWVPDSGDDTYTTNCNFPAALYNPSLAAMQALVDPQQVDGVWTWEASDVYLWMWDGLHPHSDKSGRLTKLLGKVLAQFMERISVI